MIRKTPNLEFVPCLDFGITNSLPNDGTNYLIIFDDSCDEITKTKEFEKSLLLEGTKRSTVFTSNITYFTKVP